MKLQKKADRKKGRLIGMIYKIIDLVGADEWESKAYANKEEAIDACKSEWEHLTDHDKNRRQAFYVAEYESEDDIDHDIVFEIK